MTIPRPRAGMPMLIVLGLLSLALVLVLSPLASQPGVALTRNTVRLSLAWYAAALVLMMRLGAADWSAQTALGRAARWCWTWAAVVFWVHVAMAFHYYHAWSHANAFQRVAEVSGAGEGIFVSYFFQLVWAIDAAFWWINPRAYANRPALVGRTLHAFMLFIVFNGMVVFESGPIRWAGVAMFLALPALWLSARKPTSGAHQRQAASLDSTAA